MQISRKFGKQLGKHESHKRWIAVQFGLNTNNKVGQIQAILAQKKSFLLPFASLEWCFIQCI